MKKSTRFLILLALVAIASTTSPRQAASSCRKPDCLIGPGCCVDNDCATYCTTTFGVGAIPHCSGGGTGGCCSCDVVK